MGTGAGGTAPASEDRFEQPLEAKHWRWTILSALADYIDGGSIVASGAGLALWSTHFGLGNSTIGLLAALSSNAISCGIGALIGGRLGDIFGRKRIYSIDMLVFMAGTLLVVFAANTVMLFAGYIVMGLAVGADVPTSWSLIAEFSPRGERGKMIAISNILWYIGPIVTLVLALAFSSLGVLGIRLLFVHLFIVAAVTWYLRRGIIESPRYEELAANEQQQSGDGGAVSAHHHRGLRRLLGEAKHRRALLFVFGVFCLWNIPAGTYGFFLPYIIKNAGQTSQAASVAIQMLWFVTAIIALGLVFMRVNDRTNRALLYGVTAAIQAAGFWIFVFAAPNLIGWAILNVILFGFGQGAGQWPLNRLWSVELFPTSVRNTAQGIIFGLMRLVLGVWSFFVPALLGCQTGAGNSLTRCTTSGFHTMFLILSLMLTFTAVVGWIWGPRTEGMSLERIERAREQGELSI